MKVRTQLLRFALGLTCVFVASVVQAAEPLKVCLVSGSLEYESNESLAALQKYLEAHYDVRCSRAFVEGEDIKNLPGLENLDTCDVMLLFTRRLEIDGEQLQKIKDYCNSGRPIVGVRTASHALQNWLALDKEVLGGNYKGHYSNDLATDVKIVEEAQNDPLLAGVTPFRSAGSLYKNNGIASDCRVLMIGTSPESTDPITWTRMHNGGRVFYTSLGHQQDFKEESFRRLLANALHWAAGRAPQSPQAK
jgi:type 1 glutamine amidotransferase